MEGANHCNTVCYREVGSDPTTYYFHFLPSYAVVSFPADIFSHLIKFGELLAIKPDLALGSRAYTVSSPVSNLLPTTV